MMKLQSVLFAITLTVLTLSIGCDTTLDDFDPSEDPLTGKIGGEEWTYSSAYASENIRTSILEGLLILQDIQDPCAIRLPTDPYISIKVPSLRETYNLPSINGNIEVIFNTRNGAKRLTASGGFIQVVAFSGREAIGFINATFDDDNFVEGSFVLEICN